MNRHLTKYFFYVLLVFFCTTTIRAQDYVVNHPELIWKTIETDHFRVHYHQGAERTANIVAKIAEEVHPHITGLYQYTPDTKVDFIIKDVQDYANGAAYFFDNKVEIWAENLDYVLRGTHNWLRDVVTHEYTHIISLQKALKFSRRVPAGWLQIFAYESERREDVVRGFPNVLVSYPISGITIPVWFAEGVAQFQTPSARYDYRDSHREMLLRDRVIHGKLLDFSEMGHFGKNSIGNESSYNQGFAFVRYLAENYGDSVVAKLAGAASAPFALTFDQAIKKVTGKSAETLHKEWHRSLQEMYTKRLMTIQANLQTGQPFVDEGIGNMHPQVSPDGEKIAYLATGDADYLSQNKLVIQNLQSGDKTVVAERVTGSVSWSPDGKYLAFSKIVPTADFHLYNDLFIYNLATQESIRLTRSMRARHPDWSHSGNKLTFIVETDGLTNLYVLDLGDLKSVIDSEEWQTHYYEFATHRMLSEDEATLTDGWEANYRKCSVKGGELLQLTRFVDSRQIYHPRWSPDDSEIYFDTSIGFGRDIAKIPAAGGEMKMVLNADYDERYPDFHPVTGELIYSSDKTGIFNIYGFDLKSGKTTAYTNVAGGAFMPSFSPENELFYAHYVRQGYKLYRLPNPTAVAPEKMQYIENYGDTIPDLVVDQRVTAPAAAKPYENTFSGVTIMPRLLIDYNTVKPGFYIYTNEILNKLSFFGGADANLRKDYDLFGIFEYNLLKPSIFLELFNQSANITDEAVLPEFPTVRPELDINFNLFQGNVGLRGHFLPGILGKLFESRLEYIVSMYRARIKGFAFNDPVSGNLVQFAPLRYSYLKGHTVSLLLKHVKVKQDLDTDINPRGGRYFTLRIQHEWNQFLSEFATNRATNLEIFDRYNFNRVEMNWEEYFKMPYADRHTLTLRMQGGFIDTKVDSFFHFFGGGLVGLKGYPFYSIEGRRVAIGSATYRFPLLRNINKRFLNLYFDKLYLGGFVQYGNAWSENKLDFNDFLSDVGVQLRLDTFSWYFFPTRIFVEAAYPLKEQVNNGVRYPQEWRFYAGVLFDFDLRLDTRRFINRR